MIECSFSKPLEHHCIFVDEIVGDTFVDRYITECFDTFWGKDYFGDFIFRCSDCLFVNNYSNKTQSCNQGSN